MKNLIRVLYYIYIILIFIFPIRINSNVYLASIVAIIISSIIGIQILLNKEKYKRNKNSIISILILLSISYIAYQIFQIIILRDSIVFHMEKIGPVLLLIMSYKYLRKNKDLANILVDFIKKVIVISIVSWGIFYLFKISRVDIIRKSIDVIKFSEPLTLYGEVRFEWLTRHKSEFAVLCIFFSIFIINIFKSRLIKVGLLICCFIGILLSKSNTSLIVYLFIGFISISISIITSIKNINLRIVFTTLYFIISGGGLILYSNKIYRILQGILENRNLSTLGSRTFIWGSAITTLKNNYLGYGSKVGENFIPNGFYSFTTYSNAHNSYLQDFLESGVVGGVIFILISIIIILILLKNNLNSGILYLAIIIINQMDIGLLRINMHLMYLIVTIILLKNEKIILEKV